MIDHDEFYELVQHDARVRAMFDAAVESYLNLEREPKRNGTIPSLTARMKMLHSQLTFARRAGDLLAIYGRATGRIHPPSDLELISGIIAMAAAPRKETPAQADKLLGANI